MLGMYSCTLNLLYLNNMFISSILFCLIVLAFAIVLVFRVLWCYSYLLCYGGMILIKMVSGDIDFRKHLLLLLFLNLPRIPTASSNKSS